MPQKEQSLVRSTIPRGPFEAARSSSCEPASLHTCAAPSKNAPTGNGGGRESASGPVSWEQLKAGLVRVHVRRMYMHISIYIYVYFVYVYIYIYVCVCAYLCVHV